MDEQWPHDFFPDLPEPQKSLCQAIMDRACQKPQGIDAFCQLRWSAYGLGQGMLGLIDPEREREILRDDEKIFIKSQKILEPIIGHEDLQILLRGFAEDFDHQDHAY